MLTTFLHLIKAINSTIIASKSKAFKNNKLLLSKQKIEYLKNCFKIFEIFIKATTKLQAEKYPTMYYLIPEVYQVYKKLQRLINNLNVNNLLRIFPFFLNLA